MYHRPFSLMTRSLSLRCPASHASPSLASLFSVSHSCYAPLIEQACFTHCFFLVPSLYSCAHVRAYMCLYRSCTRTFPANE